MNEFRTALKHLDHQGLEQALLNSLTALNLESSRIIAALEFASILHHGQIRKAVIQGRRNTPYIEHPLRNALRFMRWGIYDEDLIIAAILHDTIEDGCANFMAHFTAEKLLSPREIRVLIEEHIRINFGSKVTNFVLGVTNPYLTYKEKASLTKKEFNELYVKCATAEIKASPEVFLVKLTDFLDNAGSLYWSPVEERPAATRLASKYRPLTIVFQECLRCHDLSRYLDSEVLTLIDEKLIFVDMHLKELAKNAPETP